MKSIEMKTPSVAENCYAKQYKAMPRKSELLTCPECEYTTRHEEHLKKHILYHTAQVYLYECELCDYKTDTERHYETHKVIHSDERPFECPDCDYKAKREGDIKKHQLVHATEKPYHCSKCDYKTCRSVDLTKHEVVHSDDKPFKCPKCEYRAKMLAHLKQHMLIHTGERPLKCLKCDYRARQASHLQQHMLLHSSEKPFRCSYCSYRAKRAIDVRKHMMIHLDEKPFQCPDCDYRARHASHIKQHMLQHTEVAEVVPMEQLTSKNVSKFKCLECNFEIKPVGQFKNKMLVHTRKQKLLCSVCDYQTVFRSELKKHVLTHSDKIDGSLSADESDPVDTTKLKHLSCHMIVNVKREVYKCFICQFKTLSKLNLNRHMKTHTLLFKVTCLQCGYRASDEDDLEVHLESHKEDGEFQEFGTDFEPIHEPSIHLQEGKDSSFDTSSFSKGDSDGISSIDYVEHGANLFTKSVGRRSVDKNKITPVKLTPETRKIRCVKIVSNKTSIKNLGLKINEITPAEEIIKKLNIKVKVKSVDDDLNLSVDETKYELKYELENKNKQNKVQENIVVDESDFKSMQVYEDSIIEQNMAVDTPEQISDLEAQINVPLIVQQEMTTDNVSQSECLRCLEGFTDVKELLQHLKEHPQ